MMTASRQKLLDCIKVLAQYEAAAKKITDRVEDGGGYGHEMHKVYAELKVCREAFKKLGIIDD